MQRLASILFFLLCVHSSPAQFTYKDVEVLYDSVWTYENLQLVPIRFKAGRGEGTGENFISLATAMGRRKAVVKELPAKAGSYKGGVTITNKTKQNILVHSGDMISGGKQDRVLNKTTIIAPGQKKEIISTFCIEKDRWDDKARSFVYGGSGDIELRKAIDTKRTQAAVWKEVSRQYTLRNETSKTWSYLKLYNDTSRSKEYTRYFRKKFDESAGGFAGFLFITGDKLMGVELFAKSDYTATTFDAMLASYINSVNEQPEPPMVSVGRQKAFLDNVLTSRETQYRLLRQQGVAHRQDGQLLHMVVYGTGY